MNIASFLEPVAKVHGDRPALSYGDERLLTYRRLRERVAATAAALRDAYGLSPGDRVGFAMKNRPEYVEAQLACWHAGLCIVPANSKLHPKELAFILENCGAKLCLTDDELFPVIEDLRGPVPTLAHVVDVSGPAYAALAEHEPIRLVETGYDDPAWIFYTSGTTGFPKGAVLSHRNLWAMSLRYFVDIDAVAPEDTYIHAAPISHGSGLYGLPFLMKAAHVVVARAGFDVPEMFALMERYRDITFFATPTMITRMTRHPDVERARKESVKTIYYGGAPMYLNDMLHALSVFGPCFVQIFGQGESPMTGVGMTKAMHADRGHPRYHERLASTGVARIGVDVRIVDESGAEVPTGELGEVVFRSDVVMQGYWNNPEATSHALRDGWLHTGDIGVMDEDGFVTLKDRSKDMIISGGTNIYPREIEEVLVRHPKVVEASVVGRHHPDWGEEVVAFVVAVKGETLRAQELEALCLDNIARFKRPKEYFFVDELPKSNYGKILKTELRKQLAAMTK